LSTARGALRIAALLNEVFEETCVNNETALDSPAASNLAKALMAAFQSGIQDKDALGQRALLAERQARG
jgi:hypothetical protein